ncbi:putative bifunctional diguanylate cyclase/phosphodiesterase [Aliiglaciecola lipolytica]|uniref:putative bifunctional diguanylate cyclase/phosphodiesterase n=2 Tax=Aliiglaciecola TaxID=1406885 RepID=UPI001C09CFC3|nr:EAL domain-containing protein [Aliiglaciecola lipolytica]MBU2879316.1 EAL domain-containing protein [Aliiglaciecola lipolytica]MDO6750690.1 EAL domain-containing protein [Aliiglaciecola sp. 1_MG-2023]
MVLENSRVKKALAFLTVIIFLFSVVMIWSFFKLDKSSHFHQLNIRHFKHTLELNGLISVPKRLASAGSTADMTEIRSVIVRIRQQPFECLEMVGASEQFFMGLIGTDEVIALCEKDLEVANQTLQVISQYENGEITSQNVQDQLVFALNEFRNNSILFEQPVEKTVDFISQITILLIVFTSMIVLFFTHIISKAVTAVLNKREEAMKALAKSEERIKQLAYNDSLTGLPNRNLLEHTINAAVAKAHRNKAQFAVMFIDLDRFKDINDTLGHSVGDKLLVEMAERIAHTVRECDSVLRFGGDEFVAVTDCFELVETIDNIAHRIIEAVRQPIKLANMESFITASIGIACYPQNGEDTNSLLKHADAAMYQAKNAGKNQFQSYDMQSGSKLNRRLTLAAQLHQAINNEELSLVYQPIVALADNRTVGSETLLRWTNAENGAVGPDEFIPIAENAGLIIDIGSWVMEQACQQCKIWQDAGATEHAMAINVSTLQLKDKRFSQRLSDTLSRLNLAADSIHIEITENSAITEDKVSVQTLYELSELGAKLLLDDFGTGYSCLSYLKNLPFDVLKIDKSFMPANNTIASTIIAMGHELNMEIIAEGIETYQCYQFLRNLKCQYGQGYFFQKPVPVNQFDIFKNFTAQAV